MRHLPAVPWETARDTGPVFICSVSLSEVPEGSAYCPEGPRANTRDRQHHEADPSVGGQGRGMLLPGSEVRSGCESARTPPFWSDSKPPLCSAPLGLPMGPTVSPHHPTWDAPCAAPHPGPCHHMCPPAGYPQSRPCLPLPPFPVGAEGIGRSSRKTGLILLLSHVCLLRTPGQPWGCQVGTPGPRADT